MEGSLPVLRSYIAVADNEVASFIDVGEVKCLREVTDKPTSGWVFGILVELHHGYVIKMEDGTYGRLFIDSWKKSGSQVTEVNITRQYAF